MTDGPDRANLDSRAVLGARYEATIPEAERARFGRFYTPPPLAAACCRWAIRTPPDASAGEWPRVLDPAAGGGAFVVAAVERLAALGATPAEARERVTAVDVDGDALAVTERRLEDRRVADSDRVTTVEGDFLDCDPDDLGRFDAVVGNPPYVRQEGLDKGSARAHLAELGPGGETPYADGDRAIDARSDAYVYFLTNATRFLRPGGRLATVVPTKWLATRYGESLQRFLLDHYGVRAVVGFDGRAFDDALVDAALLCCERRTEPAARRAGAVRFARVSAADDPGTLVRVIDGTGGSDCDRGIDGDREADRQAVAVDQAALDRRGPGKLTHYLDAPPALVDLLDADGLVPLGNLAAVSYGQKTGANDLFVLDDADPVADRFRAPAVTSFRDVDGVVLDDGEMSAAMLDVHDYVRGVLDSGEGTDDPGVGDPAGAVLDALAADGYAETADYIRDGARAGYDDRTTCAARRVWFDLGPLERPAVLHPKFFDERVRVVHNRAGAVPSNAIDCLDVREGVPVEPLLGALNCSLYRAALECWGRSEGGGALQLMTYELQRVPAPDVRAFDSRGRQRVAEAFRAYADADGEGEREEDQRRLDAAVLDALGLTVGPERVAELREALVRRRVGGAGADVETDG